MNEQTDSLNQHHVLTAVRALLQTVQEPFGPLAETLQMPDQLVADLAPALDVVTFSPFAGLMVNTPEAQQSASKPPLRATGAPPVATPMGATANQSSLPPAMGTSQQRVAPPAVPVNAPGSTTVTPVFALPSQKRTAPIAAAPLAKAAASAVQQVAPPATPSPIAMATNPMAKADHIFSLLASEQSGFSVKPNVSPDAPVSANDEMTAQSPLTTMTLLATVVDSLLTTTPSARPEPAAPREPEMAGSSSLPTTSLFSAGENGQWPIDHEPALPSLRAVNQPMAPFTDPSSAAAPPIDATTPTFASLLAEWPAARDKNQPTNQRGSLWDNQPTPDPWTLAQLINDVLVEEARRHGVDLS